VRQQEFVRTCRRQFDQECWRATCDRGAHTAANTHLTRHPRTDLSLEKKARRRAANSECLRFWEQYIPQVGDQDLPLNDQWTPLVCGVGWIRSRCYDWNRSVTSKMDWNNSKAPEDRGLFLRLGYATTSELTQYCWRPQATLLRKRWRQMRQRSARRARNRSISDSR
jgi:hypothetical protein